MSTTIQHYSMRAPIQYENQYKSQRVQKPPHHSPTAQTSPYPRSLPAAIILARPITVPRPKKGTAAAAIYTRFPAHARLPRFIFSPPRRAAEEEEEEGRGERPMGNIRRGALSLSRATAALSFEIRERGMSDKGERERA